MVTFNLSRRPSIDARSTVNSIGKINTSIVAYFCHKNQIIMITCLDRLLCWLIKSLYCLYVDLSDLYIVLPDLYVDLSDLYIVLPDLYVDLLDLYIVLPDLYIDLSDLYIVFQGLYVDLSDLYVDLSDLDIVLPDL